MSKNYERFLCGQTHLAVPAAQKHHRADHRGHPIPRIKRNHAEQEINQAWHALPEEMRRTSVHAVLSPVRVNEKYALGTQGIEAQIQAAQQVIIRYTL